MSIIIYSKEYKSYTISEEALSLSELYLSLKENQSSDREIKLPIDDVSLRHIINYLEKHKGVPSSKIDHPIKSRDLLTFLDEWDVDFVTKICPVDSENDDLIKDKFEEFSNLLNDANFMGISCLVEVLVSSFSVAVKGRSGERLRTITRKD